MSYPTEKEVNMEKVVATPSSIVFEGPTLIKRSVLEVTTQQVLNINASWLWEYAQHEEENQTTMEDWATYVETVQARVFMAPGDEEPYLLHLHCGVVDELNTMELLALVQFPDEWISWVLQEADTNWQFIHRDGEYANLPQFDWQMFEIMCRQAHAEAIKARPPKHDIPMALALSGAFAASVVKHSKEATNRHP
jgi:hypothetical protein